MSASFHDFRLACVVVLASVGLSSCAPHVRPGTTGDRGEQGGKGETPNSQVSNQGAQLLDPSTAYRQAGLIVQGPPFPFVGNVQYLAGRVPDSTLVLVSLSLSNRSLTFTNEGSTQRAAYAAVLDFKQGATTVEHVEAQETVRVGSFRETNRTDESLVFQRFVAVPPGRYTLTITIRDEGGTNAGTQEIRISVPRLDGRVLASPVVVYQAVPRLRLDSMPQLIANPRSMVIFGRDSIAPFYLEGYHLAPNTQIAIRILEDGHQIVFRDTITLVQHGELSSAVREFPVPRIGVGRLTLTASMLGSTDTVVAPLLVSFGEQLGIMSFDQLLSYLRYYVTPERLQALRDSIPERRAEAWAAFWKETDPLPTTPEHEGLREYFARLETANQRFRDEGGPGWLTDRGKVYITLGEPDQLLDQGSPGVSVRGRVQVWEYAKYHVQLVFVDQTGFGRWELTPASEADFRQIAQRELIH